MGNSLADVLFGDVNPSGRLPLSFPVLETDTPLTTPEQWPGVNGTVTYSEGLTIGACPLRRLREQVACAAHFLAPPHTRPSRALARLSVV